MSGEIHPVVAYFLLALGVYGGCLLTGAGFFQLRRRRRSSAAVLFSVGALMFVSVGVALWAGPPPG